jgi:hypothetical protein
MRHLIQELKVGGFSGPVGPLPGYVAEVWVPTRQGPAWKRLAKSESWWMYGERSGAISADDVPLKSRPTHWADKSGGARGLKYYVRIESPSLARTITREVEKAGGVFLGRIGKPAEKKAARWAKKRAA